MKTEYRVLNREEYLAELVNKVTEEASEIPLDATADPEKVLEELADLFEVVEAIRETLGVDKADLARARQQKITQKGDFSERYYIESVTLAKNSPWIEYFRANSERYPEE